MIITSTKKDMWLVQVYHSMMQAGRGVVQQHGIKGLYRGLNITLIEIIPYAALQFGLYDTFTAAWSKAHRRRLSAKVITASQIGKHGSVLSPAVPTPVSKSSMFPILSLHANLGEI